MKYGHRPDTADRRERHELFSALALRQPGEPLPPTASIVDIAQKTAPSVLRQTDSDCVANALAKCIQIVRAVSTGDYPPLPARRPIYYAARAAFGETDRDEGCMPSDALAAVQQHGFCDETVDPYTTSLYEPPDLDVYRRSYDARGLRYHAVDDGLAGVVQIKQAIADLRPVLLGVQVDAAFESWTPGAAPWRFVGPSLGGHAIYAAAYRPGAIFCMSSWGEDFGDAGGIWIAEDEIAGPRCVDKYVVTEVSP